MVPVGELLSNTINPLQDLCIDHMTNQAMCHYVPVDRDLRQRRRRRQRERQKTIGFNWAQKRIGGETNVKIPAR